MVGLGYSKNAFITCAVENSERKTQFAVKAEMVHRMEDLSLEIITGGNMRLSTKGRYGLRAMVDLALNSETEAVSISSISERQEISESYLEQLIAKLRRAGLVVSTRGVQGGYRLTRSSDQITVGDVLRALEGDMRAVDCSAFNEEGCEGADLCVTKYVWQRINESIDAAMDDIYISQLVEESRKMIEKSREHPEEYNGEHCNG